ncbi:MAG: hypothetical protein WD557_01415 [Dehalococcoidia bacterium]
MSALEVAAKPHLRPMILGPKAQLSAEGQSTVALWAALRCIAMEYAHPRTVAHMPLEWVQHIYETRAIPEAWGVWLGAYYGQSPIGYELIDARLIQENRDLRSATESGFVATMIVGHLALKVLGVYQNTVSDPWTETLMPIAPVSSALVRWPPPKIFTDRSLGKLFGTWLSFEPPIVDKLLRGGA